MRVPRLLPLVLVATAALSLVKAERLVENVWPDAPAPAAAASPTPPRAAAPVAPARRSTMAALAETPPAQPPRASAPPPAAAAPTPPPAPAPEAAAERAVLESLRARRAEIESREQAAAQREVMLAAAERRLTQRIEELGALQSRLETLERDRAAREDAGLRGLVRLYEGMRPRDAAVIFDELEMPVLLPIVDRMREAKASPVVAAMKPDRARTLTAELARLRAERVEQDRAVRAAAPAGPR